MTAFNTYIEQLSRRRAAFSVEFQGLKFISEIVETVAEIESNFANKIK